MTGIVDMTWLKKRKNAVATIIALLSVFLLSCNRSIKPEIQKTPKSPNDLSTGVFPVKKVDQKTGVIPLKTEEIRISNIKASGVATIFQGNVENAKRAALRAAYANAVGQGAGLEIGSMSLIRNAKDVSRVVTSRSSGFIRSFKILNEGVIKEDPPRYEVFIEAEVIEKGKAGDEEREGLKLYLEVLGNPRLLIILPETKANLAALNVNESGGSSLRNMEMALAQVFSDYGYRVITSDDLQNSDTYSPDDLTEARLGVTEKVLKIAKSNNIDLVITGEINTQQIVVKPAGREMIRVEGEVTAKAVVVSSGKIIKAFQKMSRAANFSELNAYSDFVRRTAESIGILLAWKIPQILTEEYRETRLFLTGVTLQQTEDIRLALKKLIGIEAVRPSKLPVEGKLRAELILMSGYIPLDPVNILNICKEVLGQEIKVLRINKFEIEGTIKFPQRNTQ